MKRLPQFGDPVRPVVFWLAAGFLMFGVAVISAAQLIGFLAAVGMGFGCWGVAGHLASKLLKKAS